MKSNIVFQIFIILLFSSCKKDEEIKNNENLPEDYSKVVNILHDGASYESVFDTMMFVNHLQGGENNSKAGISDFTVDYKNRLNIVFWTWWQSQQNGHYSTFRRSIDLNTFQAAQLGLSSFAQIAYNRQIDKVYPSNYEQYTTKLEAFKPYTNYFVMGYQRYDNSSMLKYYILKNEAANDPSQPNDLRNIYSGDLDMAFRNPTINIGTARGYFLFGGNSSDENTNYLGTIHTHYYYESPNFDGSIRTCRGLTEPRIEGKSVVFEFLDNRIDVVELERGINTQSTPNYQHMTQPNTVASIPVSNSLHADIKTHRHYSSDGNILAFYIYHTQSDLYSTYVYNFTTKQFRNVLDNVRLDYGEKLESDVDLDDDGNLYYSGYGKNGNDKTATSIYKISSGGAHSLVGTDGFLKYGSIQKLKVLFGKVYLGVVVTRQNTGYRQVTVLRQK